MENKDQYLVYTNSVNDTFYYKNGKLHREDGPAIVCRKDNARKKFEGLLDESLYTRVYEPVDFKQDNGIPNFYCESEYYLDGVRYPSKQAKDSFIFNKELNTQLPNNSQEKITRKTKI